MAAPSVWKRGLAPAISALEDVVAGVEGATGAQGISSVARPDRSVAVVEGLAEAGVAAWALASRLRLASSHRLFV